MNKQVRDRVLSIDAMICSQCSRHISRGGHCIGTIKVPSTCPIIVSRIQRHQPSNRKGGMTTELRNTHTSVHEGPP
jgi:hypothetical protein